MRLVTLVPSVPASGESLTRKVIDSVGGSIGWAGSGAVTSGAQMVWATVASGSPARETMSPAVASSRATRSSPRKASTFVHPALLDQPAVMVEHLDRLVRARWSRR